MENTKIIDTNKMQTITKQSTNQDLEQLIFTKELENNNEKVWKIIETYFQEKHLENLVRHQIESYNNFIEYQIFKTISMFSPVRIVSEQDYDLKSKQYSLEVFLEFNNFNIHRAQIQECNGAIKSMFPQEARLRNFTYSSSMTIDINIKYVVRTGENLANVKTLSKTFQNINIGRMPVMLKSNICNLTHYNFINKENSNGECKFDAGGYFIITGSEKTVLGQERAAENRIYVFNSSKNSKYLWTCEIKCVPDFKCISPKQINMLMSSKDNGFGFPILVQIPKIKQPIPLFIVFRALGIITDKNICEYITLNVEDEKQEKITKGLQASIIDANEYLTQDDCIKYINTYAIFTPINMDKETGSKKKMDFTLDVIKNDLFTHCSTQIEKIYFLGYMTNRLLQVSFGWAKPDDRDSYLNKRVDLTGTLLNNLFRNYFNKVVKDAERQIIKEINMGSWKSTDDYLNIITKGNINKIIKSTTIENGLKKALSTGDFSIKHINNNKVGVAQVLTRLTYISAVSHLRRISTPTDKSGKLIPPRKLHPTTFGYLCLSGDCEVILGDGHETKYICNMSNDDSVITINNRNLSSQKSNIHSYFEKNSNEGTIKTKMYKITTFGGRVIKATGDHPFLVSTEKEEYNYYNRENEREEPEKRKTGSIEHTYNDEFIWKSVEYLNQHTDKVIIYHHPKYIYGNENKPISVYNYDEKTTRIITRIIGIIYSCGSLTKTGGLNIYVSSYDDMMRLCDDFNHLKSIVCFESYRIEMIISPKTFYRVCENGDFSKIIYLLVGGAIENNYQTGYYTKISQIPDWIMNGEPALKQSFLCGYQSGYDTRFIYKYGFDEKTRKDIIQPYLSSTKIIFYDKFGVSTNIEQPNNDVIIVMKQIMELFCDFNIETKLKIDIKKLNEKNKNNLLEFNNNDNNNNTEINYKNKLSIVFKQNTENYYNYSNLIDFTYCSEKRKMSAPVIEHIRIQYFNKKDEKLFMNDNFVYENFIQGNILKNGCVACYIKSIEEIEPEMVYDFTTYNSNHSFVASGFVVSNCPAETPEGPSVGIVKNLSYMTHVSISSNSTPIYDYVKPHIQLVSSLTSPTEAFDKVKVFVNGCWIGISLSPNELYCSLKEKKYSGIINIYTSIVFDIKNKEIRICNDAGRLTRPLFRVKDNKLLLTRDVYEKIEKGELNWIDLLLNNKIENSIIEYIDPEEQGLSMIAMSIGDLQNKQYKYTHCEIHPSTMFGVAASLIPFPDYNQSPRNTYQSAQCKQAIGIYATNYHERMDKTAYVLTYAERPLVETRVMNILKINELPAGCNIMVAIMTHTGYNQEDSILINKGSLDRGMFMATIYHTEKDEDKQKIKGDEEIRCKPDKQKTKGMKIANYDKINSKGIVPENTLIENRDVIISKVVPIKENKNDNTKIFKYEDQSKVYRTNEETYIDKNYINRNGDGYNFCKVRLRTLRKPVIGDKFSSRSGQKGTCGNIIPEEDMPFTASGIRPDIIINPHAIPSRMTIAQLKEMLLCKVLTTLGLFGDGTSFGDLDVKKICDEMFKCGFEKYGNELLYNGRTGEQHECSIFMGPCFYQRLKHMVIDKQHSRAFGPMLLLTHQPQEGRSRDGGLRFGEMERDAMISHGASRFTRDRLYTSSDKYQVYICKKCGMIASYNDNAGIHKCHTCNNICDFAFVEIPYACKLLFQELQTMNIGLRLITT